MESEFVIQTEQLTKHFKKRIAVKDVALEVQRGEVFGFLGPNGAGKTTTIALLLGLIKPTRGRARLFGHDVQRNPGAALRKVGAMIEAPAFYPYLSGRDNLQVLALTANLPKSSIEKVLNLVDLAQRAKDRFGTYSQGMKQRLAIAAALLSDPELIILDEPTNGLDPAGVVETRNLLLSLAAKGHTIFLSSHLLHEVEQLCQRVAILKEGQVLAQGKVTELLRRGQGVQIRVVNDPQKAVQFLQTLPGIKEKEISLTENLLFLAVASERIPEINHFLSQKGILVAEIRAKEETLEDFFLALTESQPQNA